MRSLFILIFCLKLADAFSQDTVYLKNLELNEIAESIDSANYYKVITKVNDKYELKVYRIENNLYIQGTLDSIEPEIRNGEFFYYFRDGNIYKTGRFLNDVQEGEWIYYTYQNVLNRKIRYEHGVAVQTICYDQKGKTIKCREEPEEIQPEYNGGVEALMKYLSSKVMYPKDCRELGIQGKVILKFYVDIDGSVNGVRIIRGLHPLIDEQAKGVIESMPKWAPGVQRGEYVRVYYTIPISYKLQ